MSKLVHFLTDVDLRNSHDGLAALAKKAKINVEALKVGEFVLFINAKITAVKLYGANNWVSSYKHPQGHRLNPATLVNLPKFVEGGKISYPQALAAALKQQLPQYFKDLEK